MHLHVDQDGNHHLDFSQTITFSRNEYGIKLSMDDPGLGYLHNSVNFKNLFVVGMGIKVRKTRIGRFWNLAGYLWRFVK